MNLPWLIAVASAAVALAAIFWALSERGRARLLERQSDANADFLKAQAAASANAVADALVRRATDTFEAQDRLAQAKLEAQLKPVAETLARFQEQVAAVEKTRAESAGSLRTQIEQVLAASVATQDEARKLSAALRRGAGVQGRWGEQTLRNVLEAAGLTHRFDFEEQFHVDTDEGRRRPDVKVRLPGGAAFVIDAKCSLNAFLDAQDAPDEAAREAAMLRHAQSVRGHIAGLSARTYWDQFKAEGSPDFVAMFVPGDGFLAAALDRAPDLMTEAMDRRVLVVTPTTLFALCKAVAYGWRVEDQAKGAAQIADLGRELYKLMSVMGEHVSAVGRSLSSAVSSYNKFVGSLESQVLTQARRFEDLQAEHEGKSLAVVAALETAVRPLSKLTDDECGEMMPALTLKEPAPTSAS